MFIMRNIKQQKSNKLILKIELIAFTTIRLKVKSALAVKWAISNGVLPPDTKW